MPSFFIQYKKHLGILLLVIGAISLYLWTKKEPSLQATQEPTSLIQPVEVPSNHYVFYQGGAGTS